MDARADTATPPGRQPPVATRRAWRVVVLAIVGCLLPTAAGAASAPRLPTANELAAYFRPPKVDQIALAPDGRHLVHVVRDGSWPYLVILDVDHPESKAKVPAGAEKMSRWWQRRSVYPTEVTCLRWIAPDRLLYAISVPDDSGDTPHDEVRVIGADGKNDRKLVDGDDLDDMTLPEDIEAPSEFIPRRLRVLDLRLDDPNAIAVEALGGATTDSELFKVDLQTGKFKALSSATIDGRCLYDQQGRARVVETPPTHQNEPISMTPRLPQGFGGGGGGGGGSENGGDSGAGGEGGATGGGEGGGGGGGGASMPSISMPNFPSFKEKPYLVPQTYNYHPATGPGRWQELDKYLGPGLTLVFHTSAATYLEPRSIPLTFDRDPNVLYFASNVGRDTYGIYALNLATRQRTDFAVESATCDVVEPFDAFSESALVFDRARRLVGARPGGAGTRTQWFDPDLARLQRGFDEFFSGRRVEIVDWAEGFGRVVLRVFSEADAGRYFVADGDRPGTMREFFRRAPWLPAAALNPTTSFAFDAPSGVHLTGTVALPRWSRVAPPPLVVYCRDIPGRSTRPGPNPEVQALASMGFAVAQVEYRGAAGLGAQHRDAAKTAFDRVPIDDVRAVVAWLAGRGQISPKRVALVGEGFGGFIALRALQLHPGEFRCAVSIDGPLDPASWARDAPESPSLDFEIRRTFFDGDHAQLAAIAVSRQVEALVNPVFLIQSTGFFDVRESQAKRLRDALSRRGSSPEYLAIPNGFSGGSPDAQAKVFAKIGGFLNEHLYDFSVILGEPKVIE